MTAIKGSRREGQHAKRGNDLITVKECVLLIEAAVGEYAQHVTSVAYNRKWTVRLRRWITRKRTPTRDVP